MRPNGRSAVTSIHEGDAVIAFAFAVLLAQSPQPVSPAPVAPQSEGKTLFAKAKCIKCHGEDGKGDTEKGRELKAPDFTSAEFQKETTDQEMHDAISKGVKNKKKKVLMPAYKNKLRKEDIQVLVRYVRSLGGNR
jgi:mono/diheme cytochrome c family protein